MVSFTWDIKYQVSNPCVDIHDSLIVFAFEVASEVTDEGFYVRWHDISFLKQLAVWKSPHHIVLLDFIRVTLGAHSVQTSQMDTCIYSRIYRACIADQAAILPWNAREESIWCPGLWEFLNCRVFDWISLAAKCRSLFKRTTISMRWEMIM